MRGIPFSAPARASALALALAIAITITAAPGPALASAKKHTPPANTPASFLYDTTGDVQVQADPSSVSGPAQVEFQGVSDQRYAHGAGVPINLGQFVVTPGTAAPGVTTTYTDTPFEVQVTAPEFNKSTSVPLLSTVFSSLDRQLHLKTATVNSILIDGTISGTVSGTGQTDLAVTVDKVKLGGLPASTQDHITRYTFPIRFSQLELPTSWSTSTAANPALPTNPLPAETYASPAAATVQAAPALEILAAPAATATVVPTPTPEPSTLAIFAVALAGLALARRGSR